MDKPAPVDPRVHELIRSRWSPRAFARRPVDSDTLKTLLEAAQWAPSSYNEQPWALFVATHDEPQAYARLLDCLVPFNQSWAKAAPVLMISVAHNAFMKNGKPNRHAFHDVGLAVSQLTLQATSAGLVLHQMAGIDVDKARARLKLPDDWEAVAGIALGHPGDPESLPEGLRERELDPRRRKALSDFVFTSSWGDVSAHVVEPS